MGCYYRGGIDCNGYGDCDKCGWNPAVEKERIKLAMAKVPKSESQIIAELKEENRKLKAKLARYGLSSDGTLAVKWV